MKLKSGLLMFLIGTSLISTEGFAIQAIDSEESDRPTTQSWTISVSGSAVFTNYRLASSSVTSAVTTLPYTFGMSYGANIRYAPKSGIVALSLDYRQATTQFSSLTNLSPSSISVSTKALSSGFLFRVVSQPKDTLVLGVSYSYLVREATQTTPTNLINGISQSGLKFSTEYSRLLGKLKLETICEMSLPHFFNESGDRTGYLTSIWGISGAVQLLFPLANNISLVTGVLANLSVYQYSGTGARAFPEANEKYINVGVPLEMRVGF